MRRWHFVLVVTCGCGAMSPAMRDGSRWHAVTAAAAEPGRGATNALTAAPRAAAPSPAERAPAADRTPGRLIIYTGSFTVMAGNPGEQLARFTAWVESIGGYLQAREDNTVTVRVPAARFREVTDRLPEYGPVVRRRVEAEDVTKSVFELRLRIDNAEKARARILELLARADKMEDIIALEKELTRLTADLEILKGQLRTLEDRIDFSTVTVTFQANAPEVLDAGRRYSPFTWINRTGAEQVLGAY